MTPNDFLLYSIKHRRYMERAWLLSILAVVKETDEQKKKLYPGKLICEPFGWFVVNEAGEKVKLETKVPTNEPLFTLKYKLTITPEWIVSVKEPSLETTLGNLLINLICIAEVFKDRFPYKTGSFKPSTIENDLAPNLRSTPLPGEPRDPKLYYVDELVQYQKNVAAIESLSEVIVHSVTRIGLLPAPGRKEFREKLIKEKYEGKLTDPVQMAAFEKDLEKFDDDYLKQDPAYGKFMSGKKVKGSRIKLFMTQGGETDNFSGSLKMTPIIQPLEDGIPLDPEGFTAVSNTTRYGSFARGAETINGGVTSKGLNRAADTWEITESDCGTKLGIHQLYRGSDTSELVGLYVIVAGKPVLIENKEQAAQFESKAIIVRSPQYCERQGTQTCEVCAGQAVSKYKTGVSIPLMELSGGILTDSLKLMHNSSLTTETLSLVSTIT